MILGAAMVMRGITAEVTAETFHHRAYDVELIASEDRVASGESW